MGTLGGPDSQDGVPPTQRRRLMLPRTKMFHVEHFLKLLRRFSEKESDMVKKTSLLLLILLSLIGCRKPLQHPEGADPVYHDLKREANRAYGAYKDREKAAQQAKKAFDEAPIRTGQRQSSQEDYFAALHEQEKYAQKYRYLALKAEYRQKRDVSIYPSYFKDNKPWPDPQEYKDYESKSDSRRRQENGTLKTELKK